MFLNLQSLIWFSSLYNFDSLFICPWSCLQKYGSNNDKNKSIDGGVLYPKITSH